MKKNQETFSEIFNQESNFSLEIQTKSQTTNSLQSEIKNQPFSMPSSYTNWTSAYKANGLQNKKFQRLTRGKILPGASIDLHGYKIENALRTLYAFLYQQRMRNIVCVEIICGKGKHSASGQSELRNMIRGFLYEYESILAYCHEPGNDGAIYALMKQSN